MMKHLIVPFILTSTIVFGAIVLNKTSDPEIAEVNSSLQVELPKSRYVKSSGQPVTSYYSMMDSIDFDNDGVPDSIDIDDDNDGLTDVQECFNLELQMTPNGFAVDLLQGTFHGIIARTPTGFAANGQNYGPTGGQQLTPLEITPANGYNYTGRLLAATCGGNGSSQQFLLTTEGLWAYGSTNIVVSTGITNSTSVQKITMPSGVSPSDVKFISASYQGLVLLTRSGDVYGIGNNYGVFGDGATTTTVWHQATLSVPIENLRTRYGVVFGMTASGDLYTWGRSTFIGTGGPAQRLTPTQMTNPLPSGVSIVQIALSGQGYAYTPSYYVLGSNGKVYVMGANNQGQLGVGSTSQQNTWVEMKKPSGSGSIDNVAFISALDNDYINTAASIILDDGTLLSMGFNSSGMLGMPVNNGVYNLPTAPVGTAGMEYIYVENGAHITPAVQNDGTYCNVGHNAGGGFGDGTTASRTLYACNRLVAPLSALKKLTSCDDDNDGVLNQYDTDSDNDGCPDRLEAAHGLTNFTSGTVGDNGLHDSLETFPESGIPINDIPTFLVSDSLIVFCSDFDQDGINDVFDIDDDNDGVLDAEEFECVETAGSVDISSTGAKIGIATLSGGGKSVSATFAFNSLTTFGGLVDHGTGVHYTLSDDASNGTYNVNMRVLARDAGYSLSAVEWGPDLVGSTHNSNQNAAQKIIISWKPGVLDATVFDPDNQLDKPHGTIIMSGDSIVQSSNYTASAKPTWKIIFNTYLSSVNLDITTLHIATTGNLQNEGYSLKASLCSPLNSDGDLYPNHLDVDSDNDGCFDIVESGAGMIGDTLANGPYGSNGFSDTLETAPGSGFIKYYSFYSTNALDSLIGHCDDFDGDLVVDPIDIDDDNDGVLDVDEVSCSFPGAPTGEIKTSNGNGTGYHIASASYPFGSGTMDFDVEVQTHSSYWGVNVAFQGQTFDFGSYNASAATKETYNFEFPDDDLVTGSLLWGPDVGDNTNSYSSNNGSAVDIQLTYSSGVTAIMIDPNNQTSIGDNSPIASGTTFNKSAGTATSRTWYVDFKFSGYTGDFEIVADYQGSPSYFGGGVNFEELQGCEELDTDNDGILNMFDRDSDGDGCPDIVEAGGGPLGDSLITGEVGLNGLANNLESSDLVSASINYASSYQYATSDFINACDDSDGDGVLDIVDIDDDNDGVKDSEESPGCFYSSSELENGLITGITSELNQYSSYVITNSFDGLTNTQSAFSPSQSIVDKTYFDISLANTVPVGSVNIDVGSWYLSTNVNSTFVLQGMSSGNWISLSDTIYNTNTTDFSIYNIHHLGKSFNRLRIQGVTGTCYYSGVYEITVSLPESFRAEDYPKFSCNSDTDNDGIYNHLDVDSDGDGCYDHTEAGVGAIGDSVVTQSANFDTVGVNGLADYLETNPDSDSISYTSNYGLALNAANAFSCDDTDNDGINDIVDIDDDNDGLTDVQECFNLALEMTPNGFAVDLLQGTFHGIIARTPTGYAANGQNYGPTGGQQLTPLEITPANGYNYTGRLLAATTGGASSAQQILLTSDGLWAYGVVNAVIPTSIVNSTSTTPFNMPPGVLPSDVKTIKAGYQGMVLLTRAGEVYSMAVNSGYYGDGTSAVNNSWHKASLPAPIDLIRTRTGVVFASTLSGDFYTWGTSTFIGSGGASVRRTPTKMTNPLPVGVDIVQIALTGQNSNASPSYYILGSNGKVYVLGNNNHGQLGIGNTSQQTTWQEMKTPDGLNSISNVAFISAQDNDYYNGAASIILDDGTLLSMGINSSGMLGTSAASPNLPTAPIGTDGMEYVYVENGGHITPAVKTDGTYCNVGHNAGGGFGDGTTSSRSVYECNRLVSDLTALKALSSCDDDNDGILNQVDTDSDNDGCPDRIEAGHGYTSFTSANVGSNGFLDSLETSPESGIPSSSDAPTFTTLDSLVSLCQDTDNDNITDVFDIDDDNDGIRDIDEFDSGIGAATTSLLSTTAKIVIGEFATSSAMVEFTMAFNNLASNLTSSYFNADEKGIHYIVSDDASNGVYSENLRILARDADVPLGKVEWGPNLTESTHSSNQNGSQKIFLSWKPSILSATVFDPDDQLDLDDGALIYSGDSLLQSSSYTSSATPTWKIIFNTGLNAVNFDLTVIHEATSGNLTNEGYSLVATLGTELDTDNDGTPNHLDLDSDGDGCLDGAEAGHEKPLFGGGVVISNPSDVGDNGLFDVLETTADNGEINYTILINEDSTAYEFVDDKSDRGCNHPPEIVYAIDTTYIENTDVIAIDIHSIDDRDTEDGRLTYSIVGGDDASDLVIDQKSGEITFSGFIPNFESPVDTDTDNVYELEIEVCDSDTASLCDTAMLSIEVLNTNEPPIIALDPPVRTIQEDSNPTQICTPFNDIDNPDSHTISIYGSPKNGQATVSITGGQACINYDPNNHYNGTDSVLVRVCDLAGLCDSTIFRIAISPTNDQPVANDDNIDVPEDGIDHVINPLTNDNDNLDAGTIDPASIKIITSPSFGQVQVSHTSIGSLEYSPDPEYNGLDTLTYSVCDNGVPIPSLCDTATVFLKVVPVNDPPVIRIPPVTVRQEDGPPITVCTPFTDVELTDTHYGYICEAPRHGTATSAIVNDEICITYSSDQEYHGSDTICVTVCDDKGACDTVQFIMRMIEVNDTPIAFNDFRDGEEDTELIIDVQDNDNDLEDDPFTTQVIGISTQGVTPVVLNGDSISYTPPMDFVGEDTFTYRICEVGSPLLCDTALVIVDVANINDAPVIKHVPPTVMPEDTSLVLVCAEIIDVDESDYHIFSLCSYPQHSNTTTVSVQGKQICALYTPLPNFTGQDSVCVVVCDNHGLCDTTTMHFIVTPVNDPPIAIDDIEFGVEDVSAVIDVQANDYDIDGDVLITTVIGTSTQGTIPIPINNDSIRYTLPINFIGVDTFYYEICDVPIGGVPSECDTARVIVHVKNANDAPIITVPPVTTIPEDTTAVTVCTPFIDIDENESHVTSICDSMINGTASATIVGNTVCVTYTPAPDFNGLEGICVQVCDIVGACDSVEVMFNVTPVNDPPIAVDNYLDGLEDVPMVIDVQDNDTIAPDFDTLTTSIIGTSTQGVTPTVINGDSVNYIPPAGYVGLDTFTYEICDSGNPTMCDIAIVVIDLYNTNDAPVITDLPLITIPEDTTEVTICTPFADPDLGDFHTSSICEGPENGLASVNISNGDVCIAYTPDQDYFGLDSLCIVVCDSSGVCDTSIVNIMISPVNDPPVAITDAPNGLQDTPLTVDVQNNDTDKENDDLTTQILGPSAQGATATVINNDSVMYTPPLGFVGLDTLLYEICDDGVPSLCDTALLIVNVGNVNDPPVIVDVPVLTLPEDTSGVTVCTPIADPDIGDVHSGSICEMPANGNATVAIVNGDVCITYTPDSDYYGPDSLCVMVCDFAGECDSTMVPILITPVNDTPYVDIPLNVLVPEDTTSVTICTTYGDVDTTDTYTAQQCGGPDHGTANISISNGVVCIEYRPTRNYWGPDQVCIEVCDNHGACAQEIIPITVTPQNDPPFIIDDAVSTLEDEEVTINVQLNDIDPEGNNLNIDSISVSAQGVTPVQVHHDSISYTPPAGFVGVDTFTYTVCDDGVPSLCDEALVIVTVINVNDEPMITTPPTTVIPEDTIAAVICTPISDPDVADVHTASICGTPHNGTATVSVVNGDVCVTYTPDPSFHGSDSLCVTVCDAEGICDSAMVAIVVTPINDAPIAIDDNDNTLQDVSVIIDAQINDSDIDGDELTTFILSSSTAGSSDISVLGSDSVRYNPPAGFVGKDTITYAICDNGIPSLCDTALIIVNVGNVNDTPVIVAPNTVDLPEDTSLVTICLPIVDPDQNDTHTAQICGMPENGTADVSINNTDICVMYSPDMDYNGADSICIVLCDAEGACDSTMVIVNVIPINDAPVAIDDIVNGTQDAPQVIDVQDNDSDTENDELSTDLLGPSAQGVTPIVLSDQTVSYTPPAGYVGLDTFTYTICDDGNPALCDTAMVIINIGNINDAPEITIPLEFILPEDTSSVTVCIPYMDPDEVDNHTASICGTPDHGLATINIVNGELCVEYSPDTHFNGMDSICITVCDAEGACDSVIVPLLITPVNDAPLAVEDYSSTLQDVSVFIDVQNNDSDLDGDDLRTNIIGTSLSGSRADVQNSDSLLYTPPLGFVGLDTFTYQICDTGSPVLCDVAVVIVNVGNVNDVPQLEDPEVTDVNEDSPSDIICVEFIDPDIGDIHTATICDMPDHGVGSVSIEGNNVCLKYGPDLNYNGPDSVCVQVCDAEGTCDDAIIPINVVAVNDAPIAKDDNENTLQDQSVVIDVQINDTDVDEDILSVSIIGTSTAGVTPSVTLGDKVDYLPPVGFVGLDTFTYQVCDVSGLCDTAMVIVNIGNVNDVPEIIAPSPTTIPEDTEEVTVCMEYIDPDINESHTVDLCGTPANGEATVSLVNGQVCMTYSPDADFYGNDEVCVILCDGSGACDSITVTVGVTSVNDAPVAMNDETTTIQDHPITIDVIQNDNDTEDDDLTTSLMTNTSDQNGVITQESNGMIKYVPADGFVGTDTFEYTLCDDGNPSLCDTAQVTIVVTFENDLPVIVDPGMIEIPEDTSIVSICTEIMDPDSRDIHTATICQSPENGVAFVNLNNRELCLAYQPSPNANGPDSVCVIVCDPLGACDTTVFHIDIDPINDQPKAEEDYISTLQDQPVVIDVQDNDTDIDDDELYTWLVGVNSLGTVTVLDNDSLLYTPPASYAGLDTITYEICDDGIPTLCDLAVVIVNVGNVNDEPTLENPDPITIQEDEDEIEVCTAINDPDVGDIHVATLCSTPLNGDAEVGVSDGEVCLSYEPHDDYTGLESICVIVCDASDKCDTITYEITIESVNDAPVAEDDTGITIQDDAIEIDVLINDSDVDGDELTTTAIIGTSAQGVVPVILNGDRVRYTPPAGYVGVDSFRYTVCDDANPNLCATATVVVTSIFENDSPIVTPITDPVDITEDSVGVQICTEFTDPDPGQNHTVTICDEVENGTAEVDIDGNQICVTYTPDENYFGPDEVCVTICDDLGECTNIIIPINVTPVNEHPIAENDTLTISRDETVMIDVQDNDSDVDGDSLITSIIGIESQLGTVSIVDGDMIRYTPPSLYLGMDTITYWVCDTGNPALCDVAKVYVNVQIDTLANLPDLFPNFTFGRTTFSENEESVVIVNVNEISNIATFEPTSLFIPKSSGFEYEYDPVLSVVNVFGPQSVQNAEWTVTEYPTGLLLSSDSYIAPGDRSRIALKVKAITSGTEANMTVNIVRGSGGENNLKNNVAVLSISILN